jgi:DNA-binding SARP family transcriptional activator/WD40 repeat protein
LRESQSAEAASDVLIRVLGTTRTAQDAPDAPRRDRVVLAALVLEQDRGCSGERLADALWGDDPPASAAKVVQGCIARLRSRVGASSIETVASGYRLTVPSSAVDAPCFERLVARGRELLAVKEPERAAFALAEALGLWAGPAFADLAEWDPAAGESARLAELRLQAEELQIDAMLDAGDHAEALDIAQARAGQEPLRERRWELLATALYRNGRQAEALSALRRCRSVVREELGVDPSRSVGELELRILRHDPTLLPPADAGAMSPRCPWRGLEAYGAADADTFFGRTAEVTSALALVRTRGVLAVVGPSGVGKSSLLLAGVVPALRAEGRSVAILTPGPTPPPGLAAEPVDVLVVDQAEEAFTLCEDAAARERFFAMCEAQARHGWLVLALRADRMSDVAAAPVLARLVERGLFLLGGLDEDGLRAAITRPAAQAGLRLEAGLVDLLVRDLAGAPGALPLLSHALVETWTRREGRTLTVDGYLASGGVPGAVAQSAEAIYGTLPAPERIVLCQVMLRLVSAGPEGEPTRARVPRRLIDGDRTQEQLLDRLVGSRLVTSDDGVVTLAHECLARAWPRLRGWLDDDVEGRRILHHLSASAEAWESLGRPDSELYRGIRLASAQEWRRRSAARLAPLEEDFLGASAAVSEADARIAEERARQQARVNRRLRVLVGSIAAALVVALVVGGLAIVQSRRADAEALAADARRAAAKALAENDIPQALLLAVAAVRLHPSPDTRANLEAVLARRPELVGARTVLASANLSRIEALPGDALALTSSDHELLLTSMATGGVTATYQPTQDPSDVNPAALAFSASAGAIAVAAGPGAANPVRLVDASTLKPLPVQLPGWPDRHMSVLGLDTSADGRYLAATINFPLLYGQVGGRSDGGAILVWDLRTPDHALVRRTDATREQYWPMVALSDDGHTVYTSAPVAAHDVQSGKPVFTTSEDTFAMAFDVQPRGDLIATVAPDGSNDVQLRSARTGAVTTTLRGYPGRILDLRFSHDGAMLAVSGVDGAAFVWEVGSQVLLHRITAGDGRVNGVAFSPDDTILHLALSDARQIQAWDLSGERSRMRRLPAQHSVEMPAGGAVRFSRDGTMIAVGHQRPPKERTNDQQADEHLIDLARQTLRHVPLRDDGWMGASSLSPDASRLAIGYRGGRVQVVDTATGTEVATRHAAEGFVTEVSFAPDGRSLVAVDEHGAVVDLDVATLKQRGTPVTLPENAYGVAALGGGRALVIAGDREWRAYWRAGIDSWYLVDLAAGRVLSHGPLGIDEAFYVAASPDGHTAAVGGRNGEIVVIDTVDGRVAPPQDVHAGTVVGIGFSADGSRFTSVSEGNDVALWDARTGSALGVVRLPAGEEAVGSGLRSDGTVVTYSTSGHLFEWRPGVESAVAFACEAAGRDLTTAEWEAAFPERVFVPACPR